MMHADQLKSKLVNLEKLLKEAESTARRYMEVTSKAKNGEVSEDGNEFVQFDEGLYSRLIKVYKEAHEVFQKDEIAIDGALDKVKEIQKSGVKRKIKGEPASPAKPKVVKKNKRDKSAAVSPPHTPVAGDLVAAHDVAGNQWILARVTSVKSGRYEVEDYAPEEDEELKKFTVGSENLVALPPDPASITYDKENPFAKGPSQYLYNPFPPKAPVLGVFPHTTVFYPATVVNSTKKGKLVMSYQLQFEDDTDDITGSTPSRKVSAHHVIPSPDH